LPTPKHYSQKETQNGTWAKSHNSTSTELRKQVEASPELASIPTSTSIETWPYFISRKLANLMPLSANGKWNLQRTKHGLTSYAKENKQNKLTAKQFKANAIEEQAEVTEELINALTENHTCQMEALIRSMTETMKEMMTLVKTDNKNPTNTNNRTNEEKKRKREEKHQKYNDAPVCKNCGKKHPSKPEDKCWELEKNKASCPTNWKLSKSTWRCTGSAIEIETWQPGKVLDKIKVNHTYPDVTNYWAHYIQSKKMTKQEKKSKSTA
jgi:hypothetical protein